MQVSQHTVTSQQIAILILIFDDLSTRNIDNRLTFQTFLNFFNLTGLWGAKLFNQFDQNGKELISLEEFLYGICNLCMNLAQTAKAPFEEKIKLLYCFFESKVNEGIHFKNFIKMVIFDLIQLYNYSKDELKEILLGDQIIRQQPQSAYLVHSKQNQKSKQHKIVEVKAPILKTKTSFDEAYQSLISNHNQGTYLQIDTNDLKFKIKYSNMTSLIQQFAMNIYAEHQIDVKVNPPQTLSYQNFSDWIKQHKKLFKSYYSAFQTQIWSQKDGELGYMNMPIEYEFTGKIQCANFKSKVYGFQVGDIIICCDSKKCKRKPLKTICLQGLNIQGFGQLGIQISHLSDCYKSSILWFDSEIQHRKWLQHLKIYERDSIHQNYITSQVIGNGKFSIVYKCTQKSSGKIYALKVIDLRKLNQKARKAISNQTQILKIVNHPQLIKYIKAVHTKTHEYILTDYIDGQDLFEYVRKRKFLNQFESAFIIGNIMKATMYIHDLDIIHRDLKPENIMVIFADKKTDEIFQFTTPHIQQGQRIENIKIIDFGLANHISKILKMEQCEKISGTPNYIAPELLLGESSNFQSDVFSIGSIFYFLLSGKLPFVSGNAEKTLIKTIKGEYDTQSNHWQNISNDAKNLLNRLLQSNPHERITLKQAINHKWFQFVFNKTRDGSQECNLDHQQKIHGEHPKKKVQLQSINLNQYQNRRKCKKLNRTMQTRSSCP